MEAAALGDPASPIETEVRRLRALLERGQFGPALAAAQALRAQVPENRDVLYMTAVSLRYLQRIPEALAMLAELERRYPDYSRLFQERGHCHVAMRSPEPAIQAFLRAVNLNRFPRAGMRCRCCSACQVNGRTPSTPRARRRSSQICRRSS
jgi:tetratricopeptide (TPR) repeat protein